MRGPSGSGSGRAERIGQWEARVGGAARRWAGRGGGRGAAVGGRSPVRSGHDGAQLRAAARPLLRLLGPRGHRRALVRAQGAEPRGDHHDAGHHGRVLLPVLAHRHPGPGQPPVRAAAEERDHLVRALPLGVSIAGSWHLSRDPHQIHHPLVAVPASPLLYQTAPRGAGQRLDPLPKHTWSTAAWTNGWLGPQAQPAASLDKGLLIQS